MNKYSKIPKILVYLKWNTKGLFIGEENSPLTSYFLCGKVGKHKLVTSVPLKIQSLGKIVKCLIILSDRFKTLVAKLLPNGIHFIFISYGL